MRRTRRPGEVACLAPHQPAMSELALRQRQTRELLYESAVSPANNTCRRFHLAPSRVFCLHVLVLIRQQIRARPCRLAHRHHVSLLKPHPLYSLPALDVLLRRRARPVKREVRSIHVPYVVVVYRVEAPQPQTLDPVLDGWLSALTLRDFMCSLTQTTRSGSQCACWTSALATCCVFPLERPP